MSAPDDQPRWLVHIDEQVSKVYMDTAETDMLLVIRDMLLAPDGDENATPNAIQEVQAYYRDNYCPADDPSWKQNPADGIYDVLASLLLQVFDVAGFMSFKFDNIRHKRLADLVIGLERQAQREFNLEDPQLGWGESILLQEAFQAWDGCRLGPVSSLTMCSEALGVNTLLSRLTAAGLLGKRGVAWAKTSIDKALDEPAVENSTPLAVNAAASIATQYILLAGEVLAAEVDDGTWNTWAAKLREIADDAAAAEWHLKENARKAYAKMVQIRPGFGRRRRRRRKRRRTNSGGWNVAIAVWRWAIF
ncbi:hypothetical protein C8A01DRAFT_18241 [Parachaetomium inaequale]|uniref:Uncharacterized protein n=1 Tax=Parachaetomium inaequale TaxID=2588326 RepID=A0AAN6PB20_9PEZI|nr:hypothetical protein C8A01DRAFT_18241 [Parachaetomium inaequale]